MSYALLVDDNEENRRYLSALLTAEAYTVECARGGQQALDMARSVRPLVIISDLLMPVMDGYTLLRQWKQDPLLSGIPFIIYTASYTDDEDRLLARSLGADAFIPKPVEPSSFLSHLCQVLDRKVFAMPNVSMASQEEAIALKAYSAALVRRLEYRTQQLNVANLELNRSIADQKEFAARQIAILDALPANVALIDSQGEIVAVNGAWRRFGTENASQQSGLGVGQNYLSVCARAVGPARRESSQAARGIKAVLDGEVPNFSLEYSCHSPTQQKWVRMSVTPLQTDHPTSAVVMHVDVTDRKLAELRFQESQERILLLLDSTAEGIYGLDTKGTCTFCNAAAARLLGYQDQSELIGVNVHERHHQRDENGKQIPSASCVVHTLPLTDQGTHTVSDVLCRLDGTQVCVECWSYPMRRAGLVIGLVVTFLDTTERRTLEAKFLQAQKMEAVGRLAGGAAHDFNNALQVILGAAEMLAERLAGDSEEHQLALQIASTGQRAASLTSKLLSFSRKQSLQPIVMDLNEVVRGMEAMLRPMIGKDIQFTVLLDPQIQPIRADPREMEQVLMNLAVNARDAMPDGGRLVIQTSTVGSAPMAQVLMSVSDSGCGMDDATSTQIFDPFFTTKVPGKGTGLGLSTAYATVSQCGGHIDVQSELGKGTTFRVYIPLAVGDAAPRRTLQSVASNPRGSETILLIEDEAPLRSLLARTLRAHGYRVLEAENGNSGIVAGCSSNQPIHLLLTDVILPDVNGRFVADRILMHHPDIQVLFMSGYTADYMSRTGALGGNTFLLEKPFAHAALLQMVRQILDAGGAAVADSAA